MKLRLRFFFAAALLPLCPLCGCGYQESGVYGHNQTPGYQWHSLYREDIQTVAVPVFTNRTYRRGIEMDLSKAVIEDVETHTPYKVVSSQRADTILEGEVVGAAITTLNVNPYTALPQEQGFNIVVNFTWKNLRTGQILVRRTNFGQQASYFPSLGESEFTGQQDATERLALGIVQELQADW